MLIDYLKQIPDVRRAEGREYKLHDIIYISILALLSNAKGYSDIASFIDIHFEKLKKGLNLKWRRRPTISAIYKILIDIDAEELENAMRKYSEKLIEVTSENQSQNKARKHFCFDGKKLNGSFSHTKGTRAKEIFNIFSTYNQIILGHVIIDEKESEIPALQTLLQELNLKDVVITADAIHCQKKLLKEPKRLVPSL